MSDKKKIIRIAMIPVLTDKLLENQLIYINQLYDVTAVCSKRKGLIEIGKKKDASFLIWN